MSEIGHNSGGHHRAVFCEHHGAAELHGAQSIDHRKKAAKALWQHRQGFSHGDWKAEAESLPCGRTKVTEYLRAGEYLSQNDGERHFEDFTSLVRVAGDWKAERDAEVARKAAGERRRAEETARREAEERRKKAEDAQREAHEAVWEEQGRMNELADQEAALARQAEEEAERARRQAEKAKQRADAKAERVCRRKMARAELGEGEASEKTKYFKGAAHSNEHYTPIRIIDAARDVMGAIDLDPASCETAQERIQAKTWYGEDDDGLVQEWAGTVWLNPPFSSRNLDQWVSKLLSHVDAGDVPEACVLLHASTDTRYGQTAIEGCTAICFHAGRVKFEGPSKGKGGAQIGQMIAYYGAHRERFVETFADIGAVMVPAHGE